MKDKSEAKTARAERKPRPANFKLKLCLVGLIKQETYSEEDKSLMKNLFDNIVQKAA